MPDGHLNDEQRIFQALQRAEAQAWQDAQALEFPDDVTAQLRRTEAFHKLRVQARRSIMTRSALTEEQLQRIDLKGVLEGWPRWD